LRPPLHLRSGADLLKITKIDPDCLHGSASTVIFPRPYLGIFVLFCKILNSLLMKDLNEKMQGIILFLQAGNIMKCSPFPQAN